LTSKNFSIAKILVSRHNKISSSIDTVAFDRSGGSRQLSMFAKRAVGILGLLAAFPFDSSISTSWMFILPRRHFKDLPGQFLKLFFETVGVLRNCRQSFYLNTCRDECVHASGDISERSFGEDRWLFSAVLLQAIAGETGHAPIGKRMHVGDSAGIRPCRHSGRAPLGRCSVYRGLTPVGSGIRSPHKLTGLYEKGDCYQ
jgi:hypothetical protein